MKNSINNRENILSTSDIVLWWLKGLGYLNIFYAFIVILHFAITVIIFENGWIYFLFPLIFITGVTINLFYLSGLAVELLFTKILKLKINFNKISSYLRSGLLIICMTFAFACAVWNILIQ